MSATAGSEVLLPGAALPEAWVSGVAALRSRGSILPERSTDEPIETWVLRVNAGFPRSPVDSLAHVVAEGITVPDLFAVAGPRGAGRIEGPNWVAKYLPGRISTVEMAVPGVGVRDALGWMMAVGVDSALQHDQVREWADSGVGAGGWVYAAAGLTRAEALAGIESNAWDRDVLRSMAALRGTTLPVGG